jgi:hypothetical protein
MVYRSRNAPLVQALLRQIDSAADVRLWALDKVAPELASRTAGCGAGTRFSNFNRLCEVKPIRDGSWVVLADDDVMFTKGNLAKTISFMKQAGFSLAQPSHSILGWWTSLFNIGRPLLIARDTNYVEQGPLLVVDPIFAKQILPLPEANDMGWGTEAQWYRAKEGRYRIGIIDACRVAHWGRNATDYVAEPEMKGMQERLTQSGIQSIWQLQTVNGYWWKWQRTPAWHEA